MWPSGRLYAADSSGWCHLSYLPVDFAVSGSGVAERWLAGERARCSPVMHTPVRNRRDDGAHYHSVASRSAQPVFMYHNNLWQIA